jgi:uncharacterized pyridoxamine 5'-phosphate oxidase family protein
MEEVYEFLKKCNTYYLATVDGDQPRVRPFGTILISDNKLYFQTGRSKNVSKQIMKNPKIEICAASGHSWLRVEAIAVEDNRIEVKEKMLDAYPQLKGMYKVDDPNTQVLYLKNATATFWSMGQEPKVVTF